MYTKPYHCYICSKGFKKRSIMLKHIMCCSLCKNCTEFASQTKSGYCLDCLNNLNHTKIEICEFCYQKTIVTYDGLCYVCYNYIPEVLE